jgi:NTP pyrophosphatase (non-canonical NTP hydrolase)
MTEHGVRHGDQTSHPFLGIEKPTIERTVMLNDYQANALRTANHTADKTLRLAVAGMGLAGEAAEVLDLVTSGSPDPNELSKEFGDLAWYVAEITSIIEVRLGDLPKTTLAFPATPLIGAVDLMVRAGKLTDYLKKVVGHGHVLDVARVSLGLAEVLVALSHLIEREGLNLSDVLDQNVAKLKRRYPQGFETSRSVVRTTE